MSRICFPGCCFRRKGFACLSAIQQGKGAFFADSLNDLAEHDGEDDGYTDADFSVEAIPFFDKNEKLLFAVFVVNMPEPEGITQGPRVFICHDGELAELRYFIAEKSFFGFMLCGRDAGGNHLNYGYLPEEEEEQVKKVLRLCVEEFGINPEDIYAG